MTAAHDSRIGSALDRWSDTLAELHARISHRFARTEVRARVGRYLAGLLGRVERKNGWQLAEAIGETGPQGVQRLLNAATWDAEGVRDDLRTYVVDHLGDPVSGVLIVDDTGFVKKGDKSCGVGRQYTGTVGDTANAQVGVFLAYASQKGAAFVDHALYLPRAWTDDPDRCHAAGIPAAVRFMTKIALARRMLERAFEAAMPARWIVADSFYGRSHAFRRWLEECGQAYVVTVPNTHAVRYQERRQTATKLVERLPSETWMLRSVGMGVQGERRQLWACLPLSEECPAGRQRWLLVQRNVDDPSDLAYHLAYGPEATPVDELLRVCGSRWQIEEGFAQAKGEVGLDQYEVRTWAAWHRFMTLCLLAHAYLVVLRLTAGQEEAAENAAEKGAAALSLIPLTVPEVRRLVLAMTEHEERRAFRFGWSVWRRAHQAIAARCHAARRARRRDRLPPTSMAAPSPPMHTEVTDTEWDAVRSLLPPQQPPVGRPRHDHRTVLGGIVWVVRAHASWRDMPLRFGKWETAYKRYRLWRDTGLWQRIATILSIEGEERSAEVSL